MKGIIFDIKRFSIHDGPGIRTTVFLKGCPLRCFWCHNPESQVITPQLAQYPQKCIGCLECLKVCPNDALSAGEAQIVVDRSRCRNCGTCTTVCYAQALVLIGREASVEEVIAEVLKDRPFYETSGGGMTLSGGEPMFQPQFSLALLRAAREEGLHTALDTCGCTQWKHYEAALPYVNLVLYDLKHTDALAHQIGTGVSSDVPLGNLRRLAETGVEILIRVPVIPDFNAAPEQIREMARVVAALPRPVPMELLPYHRLGESKHCALGQEPPVQSGEAPPGELLDQLVEVAREAGVAAHVEK